MISLSPIGPIPEISEGDDLASILVEALGGAPPDGAIISISHKVVSKAEGATVPLDGVAPGEPAVRIAAEQDRDPRHVQVILDQSQRLIRAEHGVLIAETHHGFVCANAGVDLSNSGSDGVAIVLPEDPDRSARTIRARILELTGVSPGVVIADSFGRAWRLGQVDVAVGCAGIAPLDRWRGRTDRDGRELEATEIAVADSIAAAADLCRSKDSGQPAVLIEGLGRFTCGEDGPGAVALLRPAGEDLFRS